MAFGNKPDFPPLLAPGRHVMTLYQFKAAFVDAFPHDKRRLTLYLKLEEFIQMLLVAEIPCEVWLDGSFLTRKEEPDDIDVTVILDHGANDWLSSEQMALIDGVETIADYPDVDASPS